jgi:hypothetical protein
MLFRAVMPCCWLRHALGMLPTLTGTGTISGSLKPYHPLDQQAHLNGYAVQHISVQMRPLVHLQRPAGPRETVLSSPQQALPPRPHALCYPPPSHAGLPLPTDHGHVSMAPDISSGHTPATGAYAHSADMALRDTAHRRDGAPLCPRTPTAG